MNTDKPRWPYDEAYPIARDIKAALHPLCERIEIAGSIRRERATVGDIEILFVPKIEMRSDPTSLFAEELPHDIAAEKINELVRAGILAKRLSTDDREAWGPKNKLAVHTASGIPIDFFSTTIPNWWMSLVVRTGGRDTNLQLTTAALAKGMHLQAYGSGYKMQNQMIIPARSERDVFDIVGVRYEEPKYRA